MLYSCSDSCRCSCNWRRGGVHHKILTTPCPQLDYNRKCCQTDQQAFLQLIVLYLSRTLLACSPAAAAGAAVLAARAAHSHRAGVTPGQGVWLLLFSRLCNPPIRHFAGGKIGDVHCPILDKSKCCKTDQQAFLQLISISRSLSVPLAPYTLLVRCISMPLHNQLHGRRLCTRVTRLQKLPLLRPPKL